MNKNYKISGKNLIIHLDGELDHHVAQDIREEIDNIINQNMIRNILFDFKNINFMDSSGIGVVIGRYKKLSEVGGKVVVVNLNDRVRKIFDLSGMHKIIPVYTTYEEAIGSL